MSQPLRERASVAREDRLPTICESPRSSSKLSMTSTLTSSPTSSKRDDNENAVRKNSRRPSVANLQPSSRTSSVSPERRPSMARRRSLSVDLSTSETVMKKVDEQRRGSIINIMPDGRRASFRTVGAKVTTLLKAKNAFTKLRNRPKMTDDKHDDEENEYKIETLPHKPCFASTLSAEAQYAMMKGYEDVVYSNLIRQYPEYRPMLRRNRTPMCGISVRDSVPDSKDDPDGHANDTTPYNYVPENVTKVSADESLPASTSNPTHGDSSVHSSRDKMNASPVLPSLSHAKKNTTHHDRLSHTLNKQSREKQLVMTYRYHRAMDILDNLRKHQGLHTLSPRVTSENHSEPLKDYNSWSGVWTREFELKKGIAQS